MKTINTFTVRIDCVVAAIKWKQTPFTIVELYTRHPIAEVICTTFIVFINGISGVQHQAIKSSVRKPITYFYSYM